MVNQFVAIDVETANPDYSSICQIGALRFSGDTEPEIWQSLVDPKAEFDPFNVSIHGIDESDVRGAPTFPELHGELRSWLANDTIVHHGHFDRTAFQRLFDKTGLPEFEGEWLDNTRVVRRTWDRFSARGYGLANLADHFGLDLSHHDALSDARVAGEVFLRALEVSGLSVSEWLERVKSPISIASGNPQDVRRDGDPNAPFFGDKIVFTGALGVKRQTAADVAQSLGFDVQNGVTNATSYLCVGIQDRAVLAGHNKSSKHRKAEALVESGQEITILSEDDFWVLAKIYSDGTVI